MRAETDQLKLRRFMRALGERVRGPGRIYFTGGATAVLMGWRSSTIDVDLKPDPEPPGFFEALVELKEALDLNVELAAPDHFIPALPNWRERSLFVDRYDRLEFFHYDPYSQTLAKLQRSHDRDLRDVQSMLRAGLVRKDRLWELFEQVRPQLIRYPALNPATFADAVRRFCHEP